jgi:hypothetical protein
MRGIQDKIAVGNPEMKRPLDHTGVDGIIIIILKWMLTWKFSFSRKYPISVTFTRSSELIEGTHTICEQVTHR